MQERKLCKICGVYHSVCNMILVHWKALLHIPSGGPDSLLLYLKLIRHEILAVDQEVCSLKPPAQHVPVLINFKQVVGRDDHLISFAGCCYGLCWVLWHLSACGIAAPVSRFRPPCLCQFRSTRSLGMFGKLWEYMYGSIWKHQGLSTFLSFPLNCRDGNFAGR